MFLPSWHLYKSNFEILTLKVVTYYLARKTQLTQTLSLKINTTESIKDQKVISIKLMLTCLTLNVIAIYKIFK